MDYAITTGGKTLESYLLGEKETSKITNLTANPRLIFFFSFFII
jgi:hypothetical protein